MLNQMEQSGYYEFRRFMDRLASKETFLFEMSEKEKADLLERYVEEAGKTLDSLGMRQV